MMLNNTFLPLILSSPGAIAFKVGSYPIRWYGICIACGFLAVYFLAEHLVKKNKNVLVIGLKEDNKYLVNESSRLGIEFFDYIDIKNKLKK